MTISLILLHRFSWCLVRRIRICISVFITKASHDKYWLLCFHKRAPFSQIFSIISSSSRSSSSSNTQERWLSPTERAAHFGLPYAPGTIAVNVTWMERGFNVGKTHRSMYPSIFNRLRAIARYWSEIATFSYPFAFNAPVGGVPIGISGKCLVLRKLESRGYQAVKTVWR